MYFCTGFSCSPFLSTYLGLPHQPVRVGVVELLHDPLDSGSHFLRVRIATVHHLHHRHSTALSAGNPQRRARLAGTGTAVSPAPPWGHSQTWAASGLRRGSPPLSFCLGGTGSAPSGCDQQSTAQGNRNKHLSQEHWGGIPAPRQAAPTFHTASRTPKFPQCAKGESPSTGSSTPPACLQWFFICSAQKLQTHTKGRRIKENISLIKTKEPFSLENGFPSLLLPQPGITPCCQRGI